jgi:DNA repair exonuclease SbcCD ATPase subunit
VWLCRASGRWIKERDVNERMVSGVAIVGVIVVGAAVWAYLPVLQDREVTAEAEAAVHVERARRLFDGYSATLSYAKATLEELHERYDVPIDVETAQRTLERSEDLVQQEYDANWELHGSGGTAPAINAKTVTDSVNARDNLLGENARLLDDALQEVAKALRESPTFAEAHDLKSALLYHVGLDALNDAQRHQAAAVSQIQALRSLSARVEAAAPMTEVVSRSGIAPRIAELKKNLAARQQTVDQDRRALAEAEAKLAELESRLSAARQEADGAREAMERFRRQGVDLSDPNGSDAFAARYEEASRQYRRAARDIHSLEHGTLPTARLERPGDYLSGRYVEPSAGSPATAYGVTHYRGESESTRIRLANGEQELEQLAVEIARLEQMREQGARTEQRTREEIAEARRVAPELLEALYTASEDAFEAEQRALESFAQAADAARSAAASANASVREASSHLQRLSSESRSSSPAEPLSKAGWIEGYSHAHRSDALLAAAITHYERYRREEALRDLAGKSAPVLQLAEFSATDHEEAATEARGAGLETVEGAMESLETAHRLVGRHWAIVAQSAGVSYVPVLFGDKTYVRDTMARYRAALEGREQEPFAAPLAARLKYLREQ